jgi:transcriptional regulator with XRE-family HTH domain
MKMGQVSVIARRLKEARVRVGLSQKQLGIKAGVDEFSASARINQYERDKHTPDIAMVERLAKVLGVPAPYFYAQDEELAVWILAFGKISARARQAMLKRAGKL